jgi:hypothetical protein
VDSARTAARTRSDACACGVATARWARAAYNEEAFRYFLTIERERSRRSGRLFLLLLLDLSAPQAMDGRIDRKLVAKILQALARSVRETDFIGWYRELSVLGAVLTELGESAPADIAQLVTRRLIAALGDSVPAAIACRLDVRVYDDCQPFPGDLSC